MISPAGGQVAALQSALAAENAAIYSYGIVGAHLAGALATQAGLDWTAHQRARDQLTSLILAAGGRPVPAAVAYQLPLQVGGQAQAITLAVYLERQAIAAYLALAAAPETRLRQLAATSMQACAVRAAHWNGQSQPFPGLPVSALQPSSQGPA